MVISTKTVKTAKTISTLAHNLSLSQYERIIILDAGAEDVWCKHDLMQLKSQYKVQIHLMTCSLFEIWKDVYRQFWDWYVRNIAIYNPKLFSPKSDSMKSQLLCSLVVDHRKKDGEFNKFQQFLKTF